MTTEPGRAFVRLYYFLDPMCSWCWAFRPALRAVASRLPQEITLVRVLGGLAPDTEAPMPLAMREKIQDIWRTIQVQVPGTSFNFQFWESCTPRRSTYRACRAVIAASQQGDYGPLMIEAIQHAYYRDAQNPSDRSTLVGLANALGLDAEQFAYALDHPDTQTELDRQIALTHAYGVQGFPTLLLESGHRRRFIDIHPNDPQAILAQIVSA